MNKDKASWDVSAIAGSEVVDSAGISLGTLIDVLPSGGNDIWVVRKDGAEVLIPALKSVVLEVDPEQKRIVVALPPGLKEIYEEQKK